MTPLLLLYRALGLGDLLTAVPALRALADACPEHRRVLAAPGWLAPLALHTGVVHEVVATEPLAPVATPRPPDLACNLHGRGPQSHWVVAATRPRRMIAFSSEEVAGSEGWPRWRPDEHEVVRWCRLLQESGIPADPTRLDVDPPELPLAAGAEGATVVHPGAGAGARRWPPERWAALARHAASSGMAVFVTGSAAERGLAASVAAGAELDDSAVLAGKTDLLELAAYVAAAGRVISGDTGVAHLATALRTPSVVLFGPTSPSLWGPPADRTRHRVLWAGRAGDARAPSLDPGLAAIDVAAVVEALESLDAARVAP
jgi:ADP-heptose:LPS heptosyltransferase